MQLIQANKMWNPFKSTGNELGEHLPDEDAVLEEESHYIRASSQPKAQKRCEDIATEYDGVDPKVKPKGPSEFDCRFGVWRKP